MSSEKVLVGVRSVAWRLGPVLLELSALYGELVPPSAGSRRLLGLGLALRRDWSSLQPRSATASVPGSACSGVA